MEQIAPPSSTRYHRPPPAGTPNVGDVINLPGISIEVIAVDDNLPALRRSGSVNFYAVLLGPTPVVKPGDILTTDHGICQLIPTAPPSLTRPRELQSSISSPIPS